MYGDPKLFRFCLGATFNTLASPANLKKWGMAESDECKLCGQKCTVNHVLSCCRLGALVQGRYRYRHDCVLRVIGHHIALLIKGVKGTSGEWVHFVVEGASDGTRGRARRSAGVLRSADDWVLLLDLGKQLRFPEHIAQTSLRPDVVLYSAFSKMVVMVELTVPGEARFAVSQERKLDRYQDLKVDCERNGWKVVLLAVEVGARGYVAHSFVSGMKRLGFFGRSLKRVVEEAGNEALRTSFWIWFMREEKEWKNLGFNQAKSIE